jgi:hypothetical protein
LLERLESLEEEYEIAILDKARESDYGREAQRRERDLQAELRRYKSITVRTSFILCILCHPEREMRADAARICQHHITGEVLIPLRRRNKTHSFWFLSTATA